MGYTINCVSINKTIFLCQSYTFYYLASDRDLCSNSHVQSKRKMTIMLWAIRSSGSVHVRIKQPRISIASKKKKKEKDSEEE